MKKSNFAVSRWLIFVNLWRWSRSLNYALLSFAFDRFYVELWRHGLGSLRVFGEANAVCNCNACTWKLSSYLITDVLMNSTA